MKQIKSIEISSSLLSLSSKIFLFFDNVLGWPFAVVGYFLIAIYNFKQKMRILAITVTGMTLICSYGWYKWSQDIHGLQVFDYWVISATAFFAILLYFLKIKKNNILEHVQAIVTITALGAWLLLGFQVLLWGWIFLLISHSLLAYLYSKKDAYFYVGLQFISIVIAFIKIIKILY